MKHLYAVSNKTYPSLIIVCTKHFKNIDFGSHTFKNIDFGVT